MRSQYAVSSGGSKQLKHHLYFKRRTVIEISTYVRHYIRIIFFFYAYIFNIHNCIHLVLTMRTRTIRRHTFPNTGELTAVPNYTRRRSEDNSRISPKIQEIQSACLRKRLLFHSCNINEKYMGGARPSYIH